YALTGVIPDGMLVRLSSIDKNTGDAYALQRQFANAMVESIDPKHRIRFAGNPRL
ncbi:MAG: exosortase-associated EpsI family protein, partial [Pseudomonadota bacterium]